MDRKVSVKIVVDTDKVRASFIRNLPTVQRLLNLDVVHGIYFGPKRAVIVTPRNTRLDAMSLIKISISKNGGKCPIFDAERRQWIQENIRVI